MEIKEKLRLKTIAEINSIAKRLNFPLRGNKAERINSLYLFFRSKKDWAIISNSHV